MTHQQAKQFFFISAILLFLAGCSWPRVKIAGDEYLLAPAPGSHPVPTSTSGGATGGVKAPQPAPEK
ncbi:MAG: hypothetical protein WAO55_15310 [Candidatus Manganitrophaceae bacterium]